MNNVYNTTHSQYEESQDLNSFTWLHNFIRKFLGVIQPCLSHVPHLVGKVGHCCVCRVITARGLRSWNHSVFKICILGKFPVIPRLPQVHLTVERFLMCQKWRKRKQVTYLGTPYGKVSFLVVPLLSRVLLIMVRVAVGGKKRMSISGPTKVFTGKNLWRG